MIDGANKIILSVMLVLLIVAQFIKSQPIKVVLYVIFGILAITSFVITSKNKKR